MLTINATLRLFSPSLSILSRKWYIRHREVGVIFKMKANDLQEQF